MQLQKKYFTAVGKMGLEKFRSQKSFENDSMSQLIIFIFILKPKYYLFQKSGKNPKLEKIECALYF